MVKKVKAKVSSKNIGGAARFDKPLANSVRESAQQIWLAGMGAFAKAQAEGKQVFDALVKEGIALQQKTQTAAEERFGEVAQRMTKMADDATARAEKQWDKIESIFEARTAKAMHRLGVPSARDVEALKERIEALSAQIGRDTRSAARKTAAKGGARSAAGKAAKRARKVGA